MSDPGVTYRTREQVQTHRKEKDCIGYIKRLILENNFATETDLEVPQCSNPEN
jgi:TPP-dependent pyruvate/acetoin dehydrogenase alpha subunit